jgi:hypothetical protein
MKYIADILGIETHTEPWDGAAKLPYYLIDSYKFDKVTLSGVLCLFMKPKNELGTLTTIKKHIAKMSETEQLPIVLELDGVTAQRRKSLIGARIPFAAPGCQLYLPFMGVALTERYSSKRPAAEKLMPSAQLLFFYYLYQKGIELYTSGMAEKLRLSPMQISRSIWQLTALNLVSVRKDGVRVAICRTESPHDLFVQARPHLLNPVRKRIYAEYGSMPDGLPLSGISALSELTMLNGATVKTVAYFGKATDLAGADTLIDSDAQLEVEVWRYDPALLSEKKGIVDVLSLAVSLQTSDDERVAQAVEEMLAALWGVTDG